MLKKMLYGLKQAPRDLYRKIDSYIINNGFYRSNICPTIYAKLNEHGHVLIVCFYVDEVMYIGDIALDDSFKASIKNEFQMIDLGLMKYFLGI